MRFTAFVKEHIVPINGVITLSVTVAAVLDFFAPQAPYLSWLSYGIAIVLLTCLLFEAVAQRSLKKQVDTVSSKLMLRIRSAPGPIWRSPAWQVAAIITVLITVLGQASKARASQGGVVASLVPSLATLQSTLFEVRGDTQQIKNVLNRVETKIDSIELNKYKEPSEALWYGDVPALKQFLNKGYKLPPATSKDGIAYPLALGIARKRPDRIELLQLYLDSGWDIQTRAQFSGFIFEENIDDLTKANIEKLQTWAVKQKRNDSIHPKDFFKDCRELNLLDMAYITGDNTVAKWLVEHGMNPALPHDCISLSQEPPTWQKVTFFSPSPNKIQQIVNQ